MTGRRGFGLLWSLRLPLGRFAVAGAVCVLSPAAAPSAASALRFPSLCLCLFRRPLSAGHLIVQDAKKTVQCNCPVDTPHSFSHGFSILSPLLSSLAGCLFFALCSRRFAPRLRRRLRPARIVAARQPCAPHLRRALIALFAWKGSMKAKKAPSKGKGFHKKKPTASLVSPFFAVLRKNRRRT